jgi:hypothetical protein
MGGPAGGPSHENASRYAGTPGDRIRHRIQNEKRGAVASGLSDRLAPDQVDQLGR